LSFFNPGLSIIPVDVPVQPVFFPVQASLFLVRDHAAVSARIPLFLSLNAAILRHQVIVMPAQVSAILSDIVSQVLIAVQDFDPAGMVLSELVIGKSALRHQAGRHPEYQ
jgi:hypothetical protein